MNNETKKPLYKVLNEQQAKDIEELREALDAVLTEISPAYNFDLRNAPEPIKKATELLNRLNKKTPL